MSRLALGTAQFGTAYGIANRTGRVAPDDVARILERAWTGGVRTLDTATAYGDTERTLGEIGVANWRIVSKLSAIPTECEDLEGWMESEVQRSLRLLRIDRLDGLLLHHPDQLLASNGARIHAALHRLETRGLVRRVGISVYNPGQLGQLWPRYGFDMIQAPLNVLDQRLRASGMLGRLHAASVDVDVRSVFLQGLLLMPPGDRPGRFDRFAAVWDAWDNRLARTGATAVEAALGFALGEARVHNVVVGVESVEQLEELLSVRGASPPAAYAELRVDDEDLIDPRRWNDA